MFLFLVVTAWFIFTLYFLYVIGKAYIGRDFLRDSAPNEMADLTDLTVIIPARNEAVNIHRCVTAILNSVSKDKGFQVIVVDDGSTDDTADIVRQLQQNAPCLQLISAGELPAGWTGKNHACWQGVKNANGRWYCFIDADVRVEPGLLSRALHHAVVHEVDLLSINPFQELVTVWERLLLPAVFLSIASTMNFRHVNDPTRPEAVANGQFMLFRRQAYEALGGHAALRDEIMEDLAFARIVKQSGHRLHWLFGDEVLRVRMYRNFSQMWEGFSKNLVEVAGYQDAKTAARGALQFLLLGWLPVILPLLCLGGLFNESPPQLVWGTLGLSLLTTGCLLLLFFMALRALKIPATFALSFPLGFTFQAALILHSQWRRKTKTRIWKDRICG